MLEVFNRNPLPMDAEWLDFLETLAGQAAIAINQTQLFEDLQRANFELIPPTMPPMYGTPSPLTAPTAQAGQRKAQFNISANKAQNILTRAWWKYS